MKEPETLEITEDTAIRIENLNKSFSNQQVLKNVSMSVEKGSICGLIGRNGSGKTVLMKCICGFLKPDNGKIFLRGKRMQGEKSIIGNMGIIIEVPGFFEDETAKNNLYYLAAINNKIKKEDVDRVLRLVGLDPCDRKKVKKYSMGMRQRLAIAQAIMEDQDIILLDEPMNNLDQEGVKDIRNLLLYLKEQGKSILLSSHYSEDIQYLCDKVYRISHGELNLYNKTP